MFAHVTTRPTRVLTTEQALAIADRRQRKSLEEAARFGTAMGSPVRFLVRHTPDGAEFEAVMVGSARTCAAVLHDGQLVWLASRRRRDPWAEAGVRNAQTRFVRRPGPVAPPTPLERRGPAVAERREPAAAPTTDAAPAAAPPAPEAQAGGSCSRRRTGVRVALGARADAQLTVQWGSCEGACCRGAGAEGVVRLRTGRWHITLTGADGRPLASLALTRR